MINLGNETEFVEFKRNLDSLDESLISIVLMLNKNGKGSLYFGAKDNGEAVGLSYKKHLKRNI